MKKKIKVIADSSQTIWSRDGKTKGLLTGGTRECSMEGCRGELLGVRWEDDKLSWPCSAGMKSYNLGMKIM